MTEAYHRQIRELHKVLANDSSKTEAAEVLRTLIDTIILTPEDVEFDTPRPKAIGSTRLRTPP